MISDDDLLLFHWQDGHDDARRREIANALARDAELGARYARLVADLERLAHVPDPTADDQRAARWQRALADAQRIPPRARDWRWPLAIAATMAAVAWWPLQRSREAADAPSVAATAPTTAEHGDARIDSGLVARSVRVQLSNARSELRTLSSQPAEVRAALVQRWINDQRALARAADAAGDAQLARTLRAFEPLLLDLAAGEPAATSDDREQLAFEWAVMQTKLGAEPSKPSPSGI
jgi:hypothetical protein